MTSFFSEPRGSSSHCFGQNVVRAAIMAHSHSIGQRYTLVARGSVATRTKGAIGKMIKEVAQRFTTRWISPYIPPPPRACFGETIREELLIVRPGQRPSHPTAPPFREAGQRRRLMLFPFFKAIDACYAVEVHSCFFGGSFSSPEELGTSTRNLRFLETNTSAPLSCNSPISPRYTFKGKHIAQQKKEIAFRTMILG